MQRKMLISLIFLVAFFTFISSVSALAITSGPTDSSTLATSTTIIWTTDVTSDSSVYYVNDSWFQLHQFQGASQNSSNTMVTSHSIKLTGLSSNTKYDYYVYSWNSASGAIQSSTKTFTTTALSKPDPPTLQTPPQVGDGWIYLTWTPPANDGGSAVTCYKVFRSQTQGAGHVIISGQGLICNPGELSTTFYNDTTATSGTTWYYVVEAVNAQGPSLDSNEVSGKYTLPTSSSSTTSSSTTTTPPSTNATNSTSSSTTTSASTATTSAATTTTTSSDATTTTPTTVEAVTEAEALTAIQDANQTIIVSAGSKNTTEAIDFFNQAIEYFNSQDYPKAKELALQSKNSIKDFSAAPTGIPIFTIVIALVVLVAIGGAAYYFLILKKQTPPQAPSPPPQQIMKSI